MKDIVAIVVARKGSRRIPDKNHAILPNGLSLVEHKLAQLREVGCRVVLGTDDERHRAAAARQGAEYVERHAAVCDESAPGYTANAMIFDMLERVGGDEPHVLWAHPTNPLVSATWYVRAIERYGETPHLGLVSVCAMHGHFWGALHALNYDPEATPHRRACELPPICAQDGAIFIRTRRDFASDGNFVGARAVLFALPSEVGWDINEPWELDVARMLLAREETR